MNLEDYMALYLANYISSSHVWEVRLWKTKKTKEQDKKIMVSTSRVTLFCGVPIPEHAKDAPEHLKKFVSKL
ncbi:hypothetical protein EUTSA_v10024062mg [Eutrema salsugineum]|uniref:Uncharacterized protein n=1 Tax=Eutrema salsugineum TaxID=72664 RepID=V4KF61_EUTSA|nr:hypothetical protein EUTSA_v10024062mg [Eutrema salsugineum]